MRNEILEEMEECQSYQKHEVVWAKILGWPWWPARISEIPCSENENYRVEFLGDTSHAFLPEDKLMDYEDARNRNSTPKAHFRNFDKALALADKLLESFSALKEESRTDYTWNKKLLTPEIKLINSQSIQNNERTDNEERSELESVSNESIKEQLSVRKSKVAIKRNEDRSKMMMKKKKSKQLEEQIEILLKEYKLEDLEFSGGCNRFPKKRKMISKKSVCESYEDSFQVESKLARAISKALSSKDIKLEEKFTIAVSLMNSFIAHKENDVSGLHRALFQWIKCNDVETILENYKSWPNDNKSEHCTDCF